MKNLKFLVLILISTFSFSVMAQSIGDYIDVVYLKNGSKIKGIIVEQIPGKSVRIKTSDGSEYVYSESEVAKFTREEKAEKKLRYMDNFKRKGRGLFFELEVFNGRLVQGLRVTHGLRFNRLAKLGVALGMENITPNRSSGYFGSYQNPHATVNLVFSGDILDKRITPFYQIEAGYGFALNKLGFNQIGGQVNKNFGGPMGAAMLGVKFKTKRKIEYKLGLDMRMLSNMSGKNGFNNFGFNRSLGARFGIGF